MIILAFLNGEFWLELRKVGGGGEFMAFGRRDGQIRKTEDVIRLCREEIRRIKAQLELNLVAAIKGSKECFYKHQQQIEG